MKKRFWVTLGASTLLLMSACNNEEVQEEEQDEQAIVAVNDSTINEEEFVDQLKSRYGEQILNEMIQEVILNDKAQELDIPEEKIDDELKKLKEQLNIEDDDELISMLQMQFGMPLETIEDIKNEMIEPQLVIQELSLADIEITAEDKQEYYDDNKESLEKIRAQHILVEDEATANEIKEKLDNGEDFSELANEYSEDIQTASEGGDLGFFTRGTMVEAFDETAFQLDNGEISEPVETEFGFHIIKKIEEKSTFEELEADIEETLKQREAKAPQEVMNELMDEANIDVKEDSYADWINE